MEMILAALIVAIVVVAILALTVFRWSKSLLLNAIVLIAVAVGLFALRSTHAALWGIFSLFVGLLYLGAQKARRK